MNRKSDKSKEDDVRPLDLSNEQVPPKAQGIREVGSYDPLRPRERVRDLSKQDVPESTQGLREVGSYDPFRARERVRAGLAFFLVAVLGVLTLMSAVVVWMEPKEASNVGEMLKILYTPLVGLVGSAVGFYYGAGSTR